MTEAVEKNENKKGKRIIKSAQTCPPKAVRAPASERSDDSRFRVWFRV